MASSETITILVVFILVITGLKVTSKVLKFILWCAVILGIITFLLEKGVLLT